MKLCSPDSNGYKGPVYSFQGCNNYYKCKVKDDKLVVKVNLLSGKFIHKEVISMGQLSSFGITFPDGNDIQQNLEWLADNKYSPFLEKGSQNIVFRQHSLFSPLYNLVSYNINKNPSLWVTAAIVTIIPGIGPSIAIELLSKDPELPEFEPSIISNPILLIEASQEPPEINNYPESITFPVNSLEVIVNFSADVKVDEIIKELLANTQAQKGEETWFSSKIMSITGFDSSSQLGAILAANFTCNTVWSLIRRVKSKISPIDIYYFLLADKNNPSDLMASGSLGKVMQSYGELRKYLDKFCITADNAIKLDYEKLAISLLKDKALRDYLVQDSVLAQLTDLCMALQVPGFDESTAKTSITIFTDLQKLVSESPINQEINQLSDLPKILPENFKESIDISMNALQLIKTIEPIIKVFVNPMIDSIECLSLTHIEKLLNSSEKPSLFYPLNGGKTGKFWNCRNLFENYKDGSLGILIPVLFTNSIQTHINNRILDGYIFINEKEKNDEIESSNNQKNIFTKFDGCAFAAFYFRKSCFINFIFQKTYLKECDFSEATFSGEITFDHLYIDSVTACTFLIALSESLHSCRLKVAKDSLGIVLVPDKTVVSKIKIPKLLEPYISNTDVNWFDGFQEEDSHYLHPFNCNSMDTASSEIVQLKQEEKSSSYLNSFIGGLYNVGKVVGNAAGSTINGVVGVTLDVVEAYYNADPTEFATDILTKTNEEKTELERLKNEIQNEMSHLRCELENARLNGAISDGRLEKKIQKQQEAINEIQGCFKRIKIERDLKEKIISEQLFLLNHREKQITLYYQTLLTGLCTTLQSIGLLNNSSSLIQAKKGQATKISNKGQKHGALIEMAQHDSKKFQTLCDSIVEAGDFLTPVISLIPMAGGPLQGIMGKIVEVNDQMKLEESSNAYRGLTSTKLDKIGDEIARKLSFVYKNQIMLLSEDGAIKFAKAGVQRIQAALLNGKILDAKTFVTSAWLSVRKLKGYQNQTIPIINLEIPTTQELLDIRAGSKLECSADDLYRKSGIAYKDGNTWRYYSNRKKGVGSFGYIHISKKEFDVYFTSSLNSSEKLSSEQLPHSTPALLSTRKIDQRNLMDSSPFLLLDRLAILEKKFIKHEQEGVLLKIEHEYLKKEIAKNMSGREPRKITPSISYAHQLNDSKPIGLSNVGNSCYINASLQALLRISTIRNAIKGKKIENDMIITSLDEILQKNEPQLAKLRKAVFEEGEFGNDLYAQQDAHQFLLFILNKLAWFPIEMFTHIETISPKIGKKDIGGHVTNNISIALSGAPKETFQSILNNHFMAEHCIADGDKVAPLAFSENVSVNQWHQTIKIKSPAPNHLIIHLKRFDANSVKLNTEIEFPEFVKIPCALGEESKEIEYDIISYINHVGKASNGGHYTTYVKDSQVQKWFFCNDDKVDTIQYPINIAKEAYIIILEKRSKK